MSLTRPVVPGLDGIVKNSSPTLQSAAWRPAEPPKILVVGRYGFEAAAQVIRAAIDDYTEMFGALRGADQRRAASGA